MTYHKPASPDLPVSVTGTSVAAERLRQRILPFPIGKRYGVQVSIFYKTGILYERSLSNIKGDY